MISRTLAALSLGLALVVGGVAASSAEVASTQAKSAAGAPAASTPAAGKTAAIKTAATKSAMTKSAATRTAMPKADRHSAVHIGHRVRFGRFASRRIHLAGHAVKVSHAARHTILKRV